MGSVHSWWLANESDPGVIIAASIIMGRALAPVNQAIVAWKQTSDARTAYDNLAALLKTSEQKPETVGEITGALDVADISLSINETQVLSHIDFELKPGEIMGLVGP